MKSIWFLLIPVSYTHLLVRDEQGRKMSKSLGNGINPLDVIAQYGADALRFTLITGNAVSYTHLAPRRDLKIFYV